MSRAVRKIEYVDWSSGGTSALQSFETRLGVFSSTLWAILAVIIYAGAHAAELQHGSRPLVIGIIDTLIGAQFYYVALIWMSLKRKGRAFGPAVVETHPRLPKILRPLVSVLWLIQFLVGLICVGLIEGVIRDPQAQIPRQLWFVQVLIAFACCYSSYLYLVLAVGVLFRNRKLIEGMWRRRFLLDAVATVVVMLYRP
jgi:hypothetical protein